MHMISIAVILTFLQLAMTYGNTPLSSHNIPITNSLPGIFGEQWAIQRYQQLIRLIVTDFKVIAMKLYKLGILWSSLNLEGFDTPHTHHFSSSAEIIQMFRAVSKEVYALKWEPVPALYHDIAPAVRGHFDSALTDMSVIQCGSDTEHLYDVFMPTVLLLILWSTNVYLIRQSGNERRKFVTVSKRPDSKKTYSSKDRQNAGCFDLSSVYVIRNFPLVVSTPNVRTHELNIECQTLKDTVEDLREKTIKTQNTEEIKPDDAEKIVILVEEHQVNMVVTSGEIDEMDTDSVETKNNTSEESTNAQSREGWMDEPISDEHALRISSDQIENSDDYSDMKNAESPTVETLHEIISASEWRNGNGRYRFNKFEDPDLEFGFVQQIEPKFTKDHLFIGKLSTDDSSGDSSEYSDYDSHAEKELDTASSSQSSSSSLMSFNIESVDEIATYSSKCSSVSSFFDDKYGNRVAYNRDSEASNYVDSIATSTSHVSVSQQHQVPIQSTSSYFVDEIEMGNSIIQQLQVSEHMEFYKIPNDELLVYRLRALQPTVDALYRVLDSASNFLKQLNVKFEQHAEMREYATRVQNILNQENSEAKEPYRNVMEMATVKQLECRGRIDGFEQCTRENTDSEVETDLLITEAANALIETYQCGFDDEAFYNICEWGVVGDCERNSYEAVCKFPESIALMQQTIALAVEHLRAIISFCATIDTNESLNVAKTRVKEFPIREVLLQRAVGAQFYV